MSQPFELLDLAAATSPADRLASLDARPSPRERDLEATAKFYRPSPELVDAVNVSLCLAAPLLLTGEPGTGKTQVGYFLAQHFGAPLHTLNVRSNTTAEDLFYHFDAVAYLYASQDPAIQKSGADFREVKRDLIMDGKRALWKAFESESTCIVLIDEIDKAPRDFPNDLLNAIDQLSFQVKELDMEITCNKPPVLVITSNSERRLPEPFLRRCVVHHIELDHELVERAVEAHTRGGRFPKLAADTRAQAIAKFMQLRTYELRKKPATAELLAWLAVLSAKGVKSETLRRCDRMAELPALATLVKDRDDLEALGRKA